MFRQQDLSTRGSGWRELALAGGAAALVLLVLVISVGLIWQIGRAPAEAPAVGAPPPSTPTPRALSFQQAQATSAAVTPTVAPTAPAVISTEAAPPASESEENPELLSAGDAESAIGDEALFSATDADALAALADGSWNTSDDGLRNAGDNAVAEPLLTLASVPGGDFAVEAELRVGGVLSSVCDQSFGLAGGNARAGQVYGGGLLFPCDTGEPRARLTDVSVWQDGYNADTVVAEAPFDPGEEWRTYRFELRGEQVRLLVDGDEVVSGTRPAPAEGTPDGEAGLWAQGVTLDVRRVSVYPLAGD